MTTYQNNGIADEFLVAIKQAYDQTALDELEIVIKKANSPDNEFEQSFFQLAYERVQEKLFNLLPFLVGFEIVNKNDDGTKALGVFGFKSNNGQTLFVPAFFMNGTVKGLELMYSKNNEQFYPLSEDFAEMFLKDEVTGIGDVSPESKNQINSKMYQGNLNNLVKPPQVGKTAALRGEAVHTSIIDFVQDSDNIVKEAFYGLINANDSFLESILRFYPIEKVAKSLVMKEVPATKKETEIKVFKLGEDLSELDDAQKEEVIKKGYYILDKRASVKKSKLGIFKYEETFTNPTNSGFYSYVTRSGGIRHALILVRPKKLINYFNTDQAVIVDLRTGKAYTAQSNEIFVKNQYTVPDFSEVQAEFDEPAEATPSFDEIYMLVNETLNATEPFRVTENYKGDDGIRVLEVERYSYDHPSNAMSCRLYLTKKKGDAITHREANIFIPKGYKLLSVDFKDFPKRYEPGNLSDVNAALRSDAVFPFTLNYNGSEYFASVAGSKKKYSNPISAKIGMVVEFGLDEKTAEELVDGVLEQMTDSGYIKLAYTGDNNFSLRDPYPYANDLGQPTYYGEDDGGTYWEEMPPDQAPPRDPTQMGMGVMPEVGGMQGQDTNSAINQANQLAQAGQKNIFDTQAIATLSKYVTPQAKTQAYMPEFVSCLDKLGRMLFLVHWETKKFEEMYGRSELPELLELLTNVFKNLGDLVIYLKRKAPELSINMSENEQSE